MFLETYIKWNDAIAKHFFNDEMAGKNVYLYLTKDEIIEIGKQILPDNDNNSIWINYCDTITNAFSGKDLLEKLFYSFRLYNEERNQRFYPLYIGYLILSVVPLTSFEGKYSSANYYKPVNDFLSENNLPLIPQLEVEKNWNIIWQDLEKWTINTWQTDLGIFKMMTLHYKYVGKPLSQCLVSRKQLKKLPLFFEKSGLIPNDIISVKSMRRLILDYALDILNFKNSIIELIRENGDIGNTIVEIILNEYFKWNGEVHVYDNNNVAIKNHYTLSPLKLCLILDDENDSVDYYYRLNSINTYPEDLRFGNIECLEQQKGWSKPLKLDFEFNRSFELIDEQNKWKAKYNFLDIKLLIKGSGTPDRLSDVIECKKLNHYSEMFLIVQNKFCNKILKWGDTFESGDFKEVKYFNKRFPLYHLYNFRYPKISCDDFELLTLFDDKLEINFQGGLNCGKRTYLNCFLPEIFVVNSKGDEELFLKYENEDEEIILNKRMDLENVWLLPDNIIPGKEFSIFVKNIELDSYQLKFKLINQRIEAVDSVQSRIPTRDYLGNIVDTNKNIYIRGNIINGDRNDLSKLQTKIEAEIHNFISNE